MAEPEQLPATSDAAKGGGADALSRAQPERSLIPAPHAGAKFEPMVLTPAQARLPVQLDVAVPVRDFRVRNLLALECSHLIESAWNHEADVPLAAGDVQLAWSEFEVVDAQLAVRVTRLA
jgi:hypothetical protein